GDDTLVIHHIEHREDALAVLLNLHLVEGLETLGLVDMAVPMQVGHVLVVGVDGHPLQTQGGRRGIVHGCASGAAQSAVSNRATAVRAEGGGGSRVMVMGLPVSCLEESLHYLGVIYT